MNMWGASAAPVVFPDHLHPLRLLQTLAVKSGYIKTDMDKHSNDDPSMTAGSWWREDAGLRLPGEEASATVFEVSFWDGCKHLAHTDAVAPTVFERVDDLVASPHPERRSAFVADHCARVGSVVRVVASNLDGVAAAELRDELVAHAPEGLRNVDAGSLEARECFLSEVPAEPVRMSFAEWAETREEGETKGED